MKAKMATYLSFFLFLCVDVCVVILFGATRPSPLLVPYSFTTLWVGGLLRFIALLLVTFLYPSSPAWMKCASGVQTLAVHALVYPVYVTLRWTVGWSTLELTWGWHTWQGVSEGVIREVLLQKNNPRWITTKFWLFFSTTSHLRAAYFYSLYVKAIRQ